MTDKILIDPNSATQADLQYLPGIGPALAERITGARPFSDATDMLRVPGISPAFLEKILPNLDFSTAAAETQSPEDQAEETPSPDLNPEPEDAEEAPEALAPAMDTGEEIAAADDTEKEETEDPKAETPAPAQAEPGRTDGPTAVKETRYVSRSQAFWMTATAGFFAFVLAIAVTLSVLSALNGGLRFATPNQIREVNAAVDGLAGRADTLDTDLAGLRTRMDNFETLGGRVTSLETDVETLGTDLDSLGGEVEALNSDLTDLSGTVDQLVEETGRFQAFLAGLAELLQGLGGSK